MSIVTAVVLSMFLLAMTGCVFSSDPSAAKTEVRKKESVLKPTKHDEKRLMDEQKTPSRIGQRST
jgi:hypothetical protein